VTLLNTEELIPLHHSTSTTVVVSGLKMLALFSHLDNNDPHTLKKTTLFVSSFQLAKSLVMLFELYALADLNYKTETADNK